MRNIVVGVTGRPEVEPALDFAMDEALRRRIPLLVLHAWALPAYGDFPAVLFPGQVTEQREQAQREAHAALGRAVSRVPGGSTVAASVRVMEGDPTQCLVSVADSAALLVVGTRGGGHVARAVHGSVAAGCLHRSLTPVAVVPHDSVLISERWLRSRVVVGLDGSPSSLAALTWGVAQAREWGSSLVPVVVKDRRGRGPVGLSSSATEGRNDLSAAVWQHVVDAGGTDLEVHPRFLQGEPRDQLLSAAEAQDLLVLGSRGQGTMAGALLGSTSRAAALASQGTVVVVREGQSRREIHQRRSPAMIL